MDTLSPIYQTSNVAKQLRQGEIVTNLKRFRLDVASLEAGDPTLQINEHDFAIILSQDCDLEQDFNARTPNDGKESNILPHILFCEVVTAERLRGLRSDVITSKRWQNIRGNKDDRFHFLEKVPADCDLLNEGLPELALDFKRYFCVQADEVYYKSKINDFKRRCKLVSPYLEHLSSRFAFYQSRIALPHDHSSDKA